MQLRTLLLGFLVLAIVVGGIYLYRARGWAITNAPAAGSSIVAFGDSLVSGVGAPAGEGFVDALSREVGVAIVNEGKPGDTTESALQRLPEVRAYNPDVVLVLLGGNDALKRVEVEETFQNLRTILTTLQNDGAVVVLLGVRGGLLGDPYKGAYRELARSVGAAYVPDVLDGLFGNPEFMSDSIHPNALGYERIASRIAPVLGEVLGR